MELFLLPKFDNSSPSVTRDKEICQSHVIIGNDVTTYWGRYTMEPFEWGSSASKFDASIISVTGDI